MSKQNIYDNEVFFNGYYKIRENENNANNIFEKTALFSLLPSLENKKVLDLAADVENIVSALLKNVVGIDI